MPETREQMRARFKMLARRWIFPPSGWEAAIVAELKTMPEYRIERWTEEQAAYAGMPAQHCHANSRWYAENDPEGLSRQVTGWWRQDDVYVLHSVVERDGRMVCITPGPVDADGRIAFIPDAKLEWVDGAKVRHCMRDGREVEYGVRGDPETVIRRSREAIRLLNAGGDPMRAMQKVR